MRQRCELELDVPINRMRDDHTGFMYMFSGAVSGLRYPRAHGFIRDDPERALEFIAYVSLLAKLDGSFNELFSCAGDPRTPAVDLA